MANSTAAAPRVHARTDRNARRGGQLIPMLPDREPTSRTPSPVPNRRSFAGPKGAPVGPGDDGAQGHPARYHSASTATAAETGKSGSMTPWNVLLALSR
jgi:hypothetical protein